MSTITFYPTPYGSMLATHTYTSTLSAIKACEDVETTQMCLLNGAIVLHMAMQLGEERAMRMFWQDKCHRMEKCHE